jgi:hypothetical protein
MNNERWRAQFQRPIYFGTGSDPVSVAVGDFNGDDRQDLAVANYGSVDSSSPLHHRRPPPALGPARSSNPGTVGERMRPWTLDFQFRELKTTIVGKLYGCGNLTLQQIQSIYRRSKLRTKSRGKHLCSRNIDFD